MVNVPDDESKDVNFIDLYMKIDEHTFDPLEPFVLHENKKNALIHVQIGKSQNASDFQDVPLTVKVMRWRCLVCTSLKFFVLLLKQGLRKHRTVLCQNCLNRCNLTKEHLFQDPFYRVVYKAGKLTWRESVPI